MKKISILIASALLASVAFMSSCTKDTTSNSPTIKFINKAGYITSDASVPQGSTISFGVDAKSGGSSNLSHFKITRTIAGVSTVLYETPLDSIAYIKEFDGEVNNVVGTETWTCTITDKDNLTASVSFVITTVANPISTYTQVILGSYANSTLGSSFASADGTVYKLAEAKTNAAKIDWLYYWGVSNSATLAAPDDVLAATVFSSITNGLATWSVKNPTRFRAVTEGAVWDNILTSSDIATIAVNTTETSISDIQVGNILAFKTAAGKLGLIKIDNIAAGTDGTITYTAKVQQ